MKAIITTVKGGEREKERVEEGKDIRQRSTGPIGWGCRIHRYDFQWEPERRIKGGRFCKRIERECVVGQ